MTHAINDPAGDLVAVMLIARDLNYLSQVQSTIRYSRKLAALGRLSAGVAHEVKNPLNAMMIHLELLRQQFVAASDRPAGGGRRTRGDRRGRRRGGRGLSRVLSIRDRALEHVDVIANEIHRLDEVVQGFLKFSRPEDLKLQPVDLAALVDEVVPIVRPEAERAGVALVVEPIHVPDVNGDPDDAAAGVPESGVECVSGDAVRRHAADSLRVGCAAISWRSRSSIRASASSPNISSASSISISRRRTRAAGSACRWSIARYRCTTAKLKYSRHQGSGTTFRVLLPQA